MPQTLICVNGHQTTRGDASNPDTWRCPECGEPVAAQQPTLPLTSPELVETDADTDRPATVQRPARGRWKRPVLLAIGLLVLAGLAIGVYRLTRSAKERPDPVKDREAARATMTRFLEASRRGDEAAVRELFTDRARPGLQQPGMAAGVLQARPGQTFEVGEASISDDTADVPVVLREAGREDKAVFKLRRQGDTWRIYGVSLQFLPDDPESRMTIDFENPQKLVEDIFGKDVEAMGQEWMKNTQQGFDQALEDAHKPGPRPEDLANEALAPIDRAAFERTWKTDLEVKGRPAGDVLKELTGATGVQVAPTPAQARALARPVTLELRGRSQSELIEEVCRQAGLYPVWAEQFTPTKRVEKLELRPGPRPYPVGFAGPFAVEVESVNEYVPHATGLITFRVRGPALPPVVLRMMRELGPGRNAFVITRMASAAGSDLSDAPDGPSMKAGFLQQDRYDRELEFPLKNLLRDVTAVTTLRGVVRVPLPSKVDSLRFESPAPGAVAKFGTVEVKMIGFNKSQTTFNGKAYPNASIRLEYKGVRPDRVRLLAYDAEKKLIAVSATESSGIDMGGTGAFSVQGDPAAFVVKVISAVEYVEYGFALDGLPLPGAAGMPEKLVPVNFTGHDTPVSVEFVRITSPRFPAKAQFRVVNHADKDVRFVGLKLTYLSSSGKVVGEWPHASYSGPTPQDRKEPRFVVTRNATALVEMDTPFLPDGAQSIRTELNKVVFSDATEWMPAPPKK